jgi:hypothetical protein
MVVKSVFYLTYLQRTPSCTTHIFVLHIFISSPFLTSIFFKKTKHMSKTLFTLLLASAVPFISHAQSSRTHTSSKPLTHHAQAKPTPATAYHRQAARTTATDSRLISVIYFENDGTAFVPVDSAALSYSGSRGGIYNDDWQDWEWKFDNGIGFLYSAATSSYDSAYYRSSQTFDASDNITATTGEEWVAATSTWRNQYREVNTYDGAGNKLTEVYQEWDTTASVWENIDQEVKTYTTTNKVAIIVSQSWNSSTSGWDSYSRATNTYDASNNLITTVYEVWSTATSSWDNSFKQTNTYDASNKLTEELYQTWDNTTSAWVNGGRDLHTYDGMNRRTQSLSESWGTGGTWESSGPKTLYSNFDGTQPQTIVTQIWDGGTMTYENSSRDNYTYNADGKVTYYFDEEWNYMTSAWETTTDNYAERYRYESYTTGIPQASGTFTGNALLYPVPASQSVTLDLSWSQPQPFSVTITDATGRIHRTWSQPAQQHYTENVSLASLPIGSYFVVIQTPESKAVRTLTVVR